MKISYYNKQRRGLITILNVVIIGGFMLGVMAIAYRASIRSLEGQKKVQLQLDYEAREQALLRSVVTLVPKYAANTMITGSATNGNAFADFDTMYAEAATWAHMSEARTATENAALGFTVNPPRNGNTGDSSDPAAYGVSDFIGAAAGVTPTGVTATPNANNGYPNQTLYTRGGAAVDPKTESTSSPLITSDITYAASESSGELRSYSMIAYPDIHFGYTSSPTFIARHNWWKLYLHANTSDRWLTGVGSASTSSNEYVLSVYEVPSQLAISSSSNTNLGMINSVSWDDASTDITITGSVYTKSANVVGGDFNNIATTDGITGTSGKIGGAAISGLGAKETYEANSNTNAYYPISKASDYARSLFLPINPGLEFFDSYLTNDSAQGADNRLSKESWNNYTRGCHQCVMKLVITDVEATGGADDQAPIAMDFTYIDGTGVEVTVGIHKTVGMAAVDWTTAADFPFVSTTIDGRPSVDIYIDRLIAWLDLRPGGANFGVNHSLLVNVDYTALGTSALQPPFPSSAGDLAIGLQGTSDLTRFTEGFSMVTNLRAYVLDDLNTVAISGTKYPPLSVFAPEIRYGLGSNARIEIDGQLGNLDTTGNGVNILNLKASGGGAADATAIQAKLSAMTSVDQLPPINVMNWLVVIQKKL